MIALRIAFLTFFAIGGILPSPSSANELLENICAASGEDEAAISKALTEKFEGKPISSIDAFFKDEWTRWKPQTPRSIIVVKVSDPRGRMEFLPNTERLTYHVLWKRCPIENANQSKIELLFESKDGVITGADSDIYYEDENFIGRGEKLCSVRYTSEKHLGNAVQSLYAASNQSKTDILTSLKEAGLMQHKTCARGTGSSYLLVPNTHRSLDSLSIKMGKTISPNLPPWVYVHFDSDGRFVDADSIRIRECFIDRRLLNKQYRGMK